MKPYQTVIDIIRDLAEQHAERTSADAYFDYDRKRPECIFGYALAILGGEPRIEDGYRVVGPKGDVLARGYQSASVVNWSGLDIEPPSSLEANWSDAVQNRQDAGFSWGDAVRYADEVQVLT